jgi:ArsR family transcriptional regulator
MQLSESALHEISLFNSSAASLGRIIRRMKVLGNKEPQRLLGFIFQADMICVSDLVKKSGLDQPVVSNHLAQMREIGVVESHRDGKYVYYKISPKFHLLNRFVSDTFPQYK